MPIRPTSSTSSPVRRDALERIDRIVRILLQCSSRIDANIGPEEVKNALDRLGKRGGPKDAYSTVTAHLRTLTGRGEEKGGKKDRAKAAEQVAYQTYVVNPFRTRFCHDFRIDIRVDGKQLADKYGRHHANAAKSKKRAQKRDKGSVERFIETVISDVSSDPEFRDHLIVTDATILHGTADRDIELSVLTDDGSFSITRYVRDRLVCYDGVERVTTVTVGYNYRFDGYSGEYTNHRA